MPAVGGEDGLTRPLMPLGASWAMPPPTSPTAGLPAARGRGATTMVPAVIVYSAIVGAMVTTAVGTGVWVAACGALLVALSDWVLGQRQFHGPEMFTRLAGMVPYHIGQTLLIVGLLS